MRYFRVRISAWEQNQDYALMFKKGSTHLTKKQKIVALRKLSEIVVAGNRQSYRKRRLKKHRGWGKCFVCKDNKAIFQHHIILLKNGGYDSNINRIPICEYCHAEIHDWMMPLSIKKQIEDFDNEFRQITCG